MVPAIFDLDGTLIDSLPTVTDAANALLAQHGAFKVNAETVATFVGWGEQVFLDKLIAFSGLEAFERAALMQDFMRHYKMLGRTTHLMIGAEAALVIMKEQGVPLGICTNKPRAALEPVLAKTCLGDLMDVVIVGDDLPVRKPDPRPLRRCLEVLGMEYGVYVGDTHIDAETAVRAEVPFLLYTEGIRTMPVEDIPHSAVFSDFAALPQVYSEITAA